MKKWKHEKKQWKNGKDKKIKQSIQKKNENMKNRIKHENMKTNSEKIKNKK